MNVSPLRLQVALHHEGEIKPLDLIDAEPDQIKLAPLFTIFEGSEATLEFNFPKQLEVEHLTQGLKIPVTVRSSDIAGLFLDLKELPDVERDRWSKLLEHLAEQVGRLARANPRITIPEFNFTFRFLEWEEEPGKVFDISVGGMQVLSNAKVAEGDLIEFSVDVPKLPGWAMYADKLTWQGVVKNKENRGFGIQFSPHIPFQKVVGTLVEDLAKRRMQRLKYPRYTILESDVGVEFQTLDLATAKGKIKDISISGTYILTDSLLPLDTSVSLNLLQSNSFEALKNPFALLGRVVRGTPDGLIIQFSELEEGSRKCLVAWISEIAGKFRGAAEPTSPEVAAKATLNISYGSDLLLVHEYLYNLSAGGFFLSSPLPLNKGDTVRFVMDLAGTSIADRFSTPPSFLGTVMRVTENGIGVQFLHPDEVRTQLETALSSLLRKTKDEKPTEYPDFDESFETTSAPVRQMPSLTAGSAIVLLTAVSIGLLVIYRQFILPPTALQLEEIPFQKSAETSPSRDMPSDSPKVVHILDGSIDRDVVVAEIGDVAYDKRVGVKVILKDGTVLPGSALLSYLSPYLKEKVEKLQKSAMEKEKRERAETLRREKLSLPLPERDHFKDPPQ